MIYSEVLPKAEMRARYRRAALRMAPMLALLASSGCATINPIKAFHEYEGGAISKNPPPPPGLNRPSPNLASVPPKPKPIAPELQRSIRAQLEAANHNQNALAAPAGGVAPKPKPVAVPLVEQPPVPVAFVPGRAIVSRRDWAALAVLAAKRGALPIAAIGFAPVRTAAGLHLALRRATAIANTLTVLGVPASAIRIEALAMGRGGAAQLLYGETTK
ncbi:MAG: hypothetical protein PHI71_12140 [Acidiphilium sp.]|nr:hypothetical protein [Acidiphilium sp.]